MGAGASSGPGIEGGIGETSPRPTGRHSPVPNADNTNVSPEEVARIARSPKALQRQASLNTKSQNFVAQAADYGEILAWLDWEFSKNDLNKDGYLDYHEFVRFVRSLDLNMGVREVFQFFIFADRDNDYRILWSEIEQDVPRILAEVYKGLPPSSTDWCTMITPQGHEVYFNKRTAEISKDRPAIMDNPVPSGNLGDTAKESVLENTKTFDVTITWLDWEFKKADFDKSGTLSRAEFVSFVNGLKIGLTESEIKQFAKLADANGDGVIEWAEVLELTPLILRKLYSAIEQGPHDWCMIIDANQEVFYLNKRSGVTTTEPPEGYHAPDEEMEVIHKRNQERKRSVTEFPCNLESEMEKLSASRRASREGTPTPPRAGGGGRSSGSHTSGSLSGTMGESQLNEATDALREEEEKQVAEEGEDGNSAADDLGASVAFVEGSGEAATTGLHQQSGGSAKHGGLSTQKEGKGAAPTAAT